MSDCACNKYTKGTNLNLNLNLNYFEIILPTIQSDLCNLISG